MVSLVFGPCSLVGNWRVPPSSMFVPRASKDALSNLKGRHCASLCPRGACLPDEMALLAMAVGHDHCYWNLFHSASKFHFPASASFEVVLHFQSHDAASHSIQRHATILAAAGGCSSRFRLPALLLHWKCLHVPERTIPVLAMVHPSCSPQKPGAGYGLNRPKGQIGHRIWWIQIQTGPRL